MRALLRAGVRAADGMRSGWVIQTASTFAIAAALLLVGITLLCLLNLQRMVGHWGKAFHVTAYLRRDAAAQDVDRLAQVLRSQPAVISLRRVSSTQAYDQLKDSLGNQEKLLEAVEPDFLPASLEVMLDDSRPERLRPLLALLASNRVVDEVDHMGHWVMQVNSLANLLRIAGLSVVVIVALSCLYIIGTTIRLGVYARREEIEILKLVGATDGFVRAPFLLEGAAQGLLGAFLASVGLYTLFSVFSPKLENLLTLAMSQGHLCFFTSWHLALGLLCGAVLGLFGSRAALGRYLEV